jgi:outer membrane lipoprotein LolB
MKARLSAALLPLLLAACAATPPREIAPLTAVPPAFEMSGRISIRQGQASEIARLRWTHRPASDLWIIASPLGNEVARIESSPQGATLSQGSGPPQAAPSFAALTQRALGVALEPAALAAWLHGDVASAAATGWAVTLEETQPAGAVTLARRISAARGEVVVRLVVDDYQALRD